MYISTTYVFFNGECHFVFHHLHKLGWMRYEDALPTHQKVLYLTYEGEKLSPRLKQLGKA